MSIMVACSSIKCFTKSLNHIAEYKKQDKVKKQQYKKQDEVEKQQEVESAARVTDKDERKRKAM